MTSPSQQRVFQWLAVLAMAWVCVGCATYTQRARPAIEAWGAGDAQTAAARFSEMARKHGSGKDRLVWLLESGTALRVLGDFTNSQRYFDAAASAVSEYDQQARVSLSRESFALVSNQENLPYRGRWCDRIMLHTYRALNFLAMGQIHKARPELIRAYQLQQEAVREHARQIERAREAEANAPDRELIERVRSDPAFQDRVAQLCPMPEGFHLYADFVNPFTVYLDGLYFLYAGEGGSDLERAVKSLNRVGEVVSDRELIRADLEQAARIGAGHTPEPTTYVILESGLGPILEQDRLDIPILVYDVSYVGLAMPRLVFREGALPSLAVELGGATVQTVQLASMDAVFAREFKSELDLVLTKTLISAVAKATAAYFINREVRQHSESLGLLARLLTAAAQAAVNIADTRCWTTLPKTFSVARVPTPASRRITLRAIGHPPVTVNLLDGTINVVYVRSLTATGPLLIHQFVLR